MSTAEAPNAQGASHRVTTPGGRGRHTVSEIETALAEAQELKVWWADVEAGKTSIERFEIFPESPEMKSWWGFFGEARVQGKTVPVMGDIGDFFFDRPRVPASNQKQAAEWMLEQVEEFALHYWMRTRLLVLPSAYPELGHLAPPPYLQDFSWCPTPDAELSGSGEFQRSYKLRENGYIGEFPAKDRAVFIDLRELETTYEWITLRTPMFGFNITVGVAGSDFPSLVVPAKLTGHSATNADLTANQRNPEPGTLGLFGPGYAMIETNSQDSGLAYVPGQIQPGLVQQYLRVLDSGEVRANTLTILRRPEKILNVSLNPLNWGFRAAELLTLGTSKRLLAPIQKALDQLPMRGIGFDPLLSSIRLLNRLTGNQAANQLCISKEQIDKEFLTIHSKGMLQMTLATRPTWIQVPNWLDTGAIPEWIVQGYPASA